MTGREVRDELNKLTDDELDLDVYTTILCEDGDPLIQLSTSYVKVEGEGKNKQIVMV